LPGILSNEEGIRGSFADAQSAPFPLPGTGARPGRHQMHFIPVSGIAISVPVLLLASRANPGFHAKADRPGLKM